jgi:hypothetical protein
MARWVHSAVASHVAGGRYGLIETLLTGAGCLLLMGFFSLVLVLGLCARRWQVGDRGSDGDGASSSSPLKMGASDDAKKSGNWFRKKNKKKKKKQQQQQEEEEEKDGSCKESMNNAMNLQQQQQQQQQQLQHQQQLRSPIWQHTILMGERCKRPTFSGLILYDDKGNPLPLRALTPPRTAAAVK